MSLSRKAMLDEMGISPQWVLRDAPTVARQASPEAALPPAQPVPPPPAQPAARPVRAMSPALTAPPSAPPPSPQEILPDEVTPTSKTAQTPQMPQTAQIAQMDWETLNRTIRTCQTCGLCAARKQAVPGVGDENADWLFIGEGPGAEEDARGEPFVGQAGKLLDAMLAAIDLQRGANVYIANAVKCRPPGNRTPEMTEMAACRPYLQRQIALIQPRLIVLLGKTAAQSILGTDETLSRLRGRVFTYRDGETEIPLLVSYHPAYLLRNLPDKSKSWEDLCRARALMKKLPAEPNE